MAKEVWRNERDRIYLPGVDRPVDVEALLKDLKTKPFYWQEYFNKLEIPSVQNLKEEFEQLRRQGPKWSLTQYARMQHIEEHLDKGEVVCRCYEGGPLDGESRAD